MKKDDKLLLIGLGALLLIHLSVYFIPDSTIVIGILIFIGAVSIYHKWFYHPYKQMDETQ